MAGMQDNKQHMAGGCWLYVAGGRFCLSGWEDHPHHGWALGDPLFTPHRALVLVLSMPGRVEVGVLDLWVACQRTLHGQRKPDRPYLVSERVVGAAAAAAAPTR